MAGIQFLVFLLFLALASALDVLEGNYNVTKACSMIKPGRWVGSIAACSTYYHCNAQGQPTKLECPEGYSFDLTRSVCAPKNKVKCYVGLEDPCTITTGTVWVPVPKTCRNYYYCVNGVNKGEGSCKSSQVFNAIAQKCSHGECDDATITADEQTLTSWCEVMPANVYFGDTKDCDIWQYCTAEGKYESGTCTTNTNGQTVFDVSLEACNYKKANTCDRLNTGEDSPISMDCTGDEISPHPSICGSWFVCVDDKKVLKNCPDNFYFDVNEEKCVLRSVATPVEGCNTCQYSTSQFVNAVDPSCAKYYYCYGDTLSEDSCATGKYFDEDLQGCRSEKTLPAYREKHGACKAVSPPIQVKK